MRRFWRAMLASTDRSVEAHLFLLCVGAAALIALSVYHVVALRNPFDPAPYGEGLGYLLAGGGAAAWGQGLQRRSEKGKNDDDAA